MRTKPKRISTYTIIDGGVVENRTYLSRESFAKTLREFRNEGASVKRLGKSRIVVDTHTHILSIYIDYTPSGHNEQLKFESVLDDNKFVVFRNRDRLASWLKQRKHLVKIHMTEFGYIEKIYCIGGECYHLAEINEFSVSTLRTDYANNFLTITRFSEFYCLSEKTARRITRRLK